MFRERTSILYIHRYDKIALNLFTESEHRDAKGILGLDIGFVQPISLFGLVKQPISSLSGLVKLVPEESAPVATKDLSNSIEGMSNFVHFRHAFWGNKESNKMYMYFTQ